MKECAELFAEKADSSGHISITDLQILLSSVGKSFTKSDLDRISKIGQNGKYTMGQFMSFLTTEEIATDELYQIFRELDKNGKKIERRRFLQAENFCTKFDLLNDFFQTTNHFTV